LIRLAVFLAGGRARSNIHEMTKNEAIPSFVIRHSTFAIPFIPGGCHLSQSD